MQCKIPEGAKFCKVTLQNPYVKAHPVLSTIPYNKCDALCKGRTEVKQIWYKVKPEEEFNYVDVGQSFFAAG
jgi:hypothetical protein